MSPRRNPRQLRRKGSEVLRTKPDNHPARHTRTQGSARFPQGTADPLCLNNGMTVMKAIAARVRQLELLLLGGVGVESLLFVYGVNANLRDKLQGHDRPQF